MQILFDNKTIKNLKMPLNALNSSMRKNVSFKSNDIFNNDFFEFTDFNNLSLEDKNAALDDYFNLFNSRREKMYLFSNSASALIDTFNSFFVLPRHRGYVNHATSKANIQTVDDYLKMVNVFHSPDTFNYFKTNKVDFLEIYSCLENRYDLQKYPEFLYLLNLKTSYTNPDNKKDVINKYCSILNKLNLKSIDEFHRKFYHLSNKFNNFETINDYTNALDFINSSYDAKLKLLEPISKKFSSNNRLSSPEMIYSIIPDIVDSVYSSSNGESLQDFDSYATMAVSSDKFTKKALLSVASLYDSFKTPEERINFFKKLIKNNLSISDFNKLYDKPIIQLDNPISLINNMNSIINIVSEKDGMNKQKARELYLKFPDILNVAYSFQTSDIDVLSETIDFIKKFKVSDSKNFLNYYNNCNSSKKNTLAPDDVVEFIDLMRFADNSIQVNKKYKKSVLPELRIDKEKFISIKDNIDNFLLSKGEEFFVSESSLSIFNKYKKHLVNCNSQQLCKKLDEILTFNIQNEEEYTRISNDLKQFANYFNSKETLYKFISDNDVPFEAGKENEEYRQNCLFFLNTMYDENDIENSFDDIQKLSDSKFLLKSKASLSTFKNDWFFDYSHKEVLNTLLDKKVPSYQSFKDFYSFCRTNKSSYSDLVSLLRKLPDDVSFNEFVSLFKSLQDQIKNTNYPIKLDVANMQNISYEDFVNSTREFNPVIINKLLGCDESINPASCIPNIKTYYMDDIDALQVAIELVNEQYSYGEKYDDLFRILELDKQSLGLSPRASKFAHIDAVTRSIPIEFMKFVNSISKINDVKNYNMSIHSVLRLIERFLAVDAKNINQLCSPHRLNKANDILASVYEQCPYDIRYDKKSPDRMIIKNNFDGMPITSVFSKDGKMITIFDDWIK